jgi:glutamate racemase
MTKVGICDWGIGGLGVYQSLRKVHPRVDVVYFSDAGFTPYGKVEKEALSARWMQVKSFFDRQEVDLILVACNALSTVVSPSENIITIAAAVKELILAHKEDPVAVLGGVRTIESKIYELGFSSHQGIIAQPLSALVEKGEVEGKQVRQEVKMVVGNLEGIEQVVLACTHYPALLSIFHLLYPDVRFVDPVDEMLRALPPLDHGEGNSVFYTTGASDQMIAAAEKAFNVEIEHVTKVTLP